MTSATIETPETTRNANVRLRGIDGCCQAAHLSHEARLLKYHAVPYVKREPVRALGIALGVGLACGLVVGWAGRGRVAS